MLKKKGLLGALIFLTFMISFAVIIGTGFSDETGTKVQSNGEITMNATEEYVDALPDDLKNDLNQQLNRETIDNQRTFLRTMVTNNNDINLQLTMTPEGEFFSVKGSGSITLLGETSQLTLNESIISKAELGSGETFVYGPLDAKMTLGTGETKDIIIGIGAIVETGQRYFSLTMGNLGDKELTYLTFGDTSFLNEEIQKIQLENAGG